MSNDYTKPGDHQQQYGTFAGGPPVYPPQQPAMGFPQPVTPPLLRLLTMPTAIKLFPVTPVTPPLLRLLTMPTAIKLFPFDWGWQPWGQFRDRPTKD
ncbi:uncharacterized protein A4U43_C01F31170 [Asparagus officinalis]|uniref:Uncharacterized protein n=1 Tax=Asparagus officinalis TaxID=4686 RepID=A0A5P1FWG5_ASPOF|nr:uncharacterized protein A4U43_C01F31170 [Asparagus officinalis]